MKIVFVCMALYLAAVSPFITAVKEGEAMTANTASLKLPAAMPQQPPPVEQKAQSEDNPLSVNPAEQLSLMEVFELQAPLPNDPFYNLQWALEKIGSGALGSIVGDSKRVKVAILDTGIDSGHEDLIGKVSAKVNFSSSQNNQDVYGHGTPIAGIIAANSNNALGISGIAPQSYLLDVKVADDTGQSRIPDLIKGIYWAVDHGASVINISLEFSQPAEELEHAIDYAWQKGILVVAAASNVNASRPTYPCAYKNVLAVVATRADDTIGPLSDYGQWVDVAAPGFDIFSLLPGNQYGYKSGTSFATAQVSGLAALLFGFISDTDGDGKVNDEVLDAIKSGGEQIYTGSTKVTMISESGSLAYLGDPD